MVNRREGGRERRREEKRQRREIVYTPSTETQERGMKKKKQPVRPPGTDADGSLTFRTCPYFSGSVSWHPNNLILATCDRLIYITVPYKFSLHCS